MPTPKDVGLKVRFPMCFLLTLLYNVGFKSIGIDPHEFDRIFLSLAVCFCAGLHHLQSADNKTRMSPLDNHLQRTVLLLPPCSENLVKKHGV